MTPEELLRKGEIGKYFIETAPPVAPVRNVAEFDRMQGALIAYPFGIPMLLIKEMATEIKVTTIVASNAQKNIVINQYVANGVDTSHCNFLIAPTDTYWTRDYGPWFESDSNNQIGIVDFPYNRPRPNDDEIPKKVATMLGIPWFGMNLIHTGGNYMTSGYGISSSTELVWEENPSQTHLQVAQKVHDYLGVENYFVRPDPNGTYIDHIDCWGKFLGPDKVLIRKVPPSHSRYTMIEAAAAFWAATNCSYGYPYKVYRVNTPQDQPYTNSVILNNKVMVPIMNSMWDDSALAVYQAAMPGYEVIGFVGNPSAPWESTDALHCRVMGLADLGILFVKHNPIWGTQPCEMNYMINADIIACSDSAIKNDSVLIWYKVNNGNFQAVNMTNTSANHYSGMIPKQQAGSTVKYYISAADRSNRRATTPFIGAADPFSFTTTYTNITAAPDTLWFTTIEDAMNGQVTRLHNYMANAISLTNIQQEGESGWPWVDSLSVTSFPHLMNPGDSEYVRVRIPLPVEGAPATLYLIDSLRYTTTAGAQHLVIMINTDLLSGINKNPGTRVLRNSYPNPFSSVTFIPLEIKQSCHVTLEILDVRGFLIKTLVSKVLDPGTPAIQWDGTDAGGNKLPGGIYLCRLTTENKVETNRMVLLR
jgi:agmatine/peptidylarginine deiminase